MKLEWDDVKNEANIKKHGIDFNDLVPLFSSGNYIVEFDSEHSTESEDRFRAKGFIQQHGFICVVFIEQVEDVIRIISARKEKL